MKYRYLFLLATILLMATGISVAGTQQKQFALNGIWQMCFYRSSTPGVPGELKTSNSFKILTDDGQFANMVMMPDGAIIIGSGTYKQTSSNKYVETVEKNLHLPQLAGKNNEIEFELKSDDTIVLKYFLTEDKDGNRIDSWCYETWKRVIMPNKYPENIIR